MTPHKTTRIDKLNKVAGYKINVQISVAFLHTSNDTSEKESLKKIPFKSASKNK